MKMLKRTLCIFLSVLILFFGVSNSYFSPDKMDEAHAMGATYMTYETMQAICYYLGSLFLGYSVSAEVPDLTEDQIMQLGHAYIKSLYDVSGVNPFISDQLADTTQTLFTLISNKQAYVFGSEALKEVAETEFTVIMGGGNDNDENDDEKEDENGNTYKKINIGNAVDCLGALSLAGVSLFEDSMQYWIDLFSKGEPNIIDDTYFADILREQYFDSEVINKMLSGETWELNLQWSQKYWCSYCTKTLTTGFCTMTSQETGTRAIYQDISDPLNPTLEVRYYDGTANKAYVDINTATIIFPCCGQSMNLGNKTFISDYISASTNIPIFRSAETALNFLKTGEGYADAINYLKDYRIADWLQDDWSGVLVDPLTGLSYLNDLAQLARQQGLNGLGDNPDLSDVNDYLRDKLQDINQQYDPATNPLVDPALDPIPYPSTLPVPIIDPTSPIVVQPVAGPEPVPSTKPDPLPSTDPAVDPVPLPENVPDGLEDIADSVPAVADSLADIGGTLKTKFPFSIPWDIYYILNGLATTPKAPCFELPLKVERLGINETIIVDMSRFQVLSDLSRSIFSMLFMIVLINLSIKVIGSIKEES